MPRNRPKSYEIPIATYQSKLEPVPTEQKAQGPTGCGSRTSQRLSRGSVRGGPAKLTIPTSGGLQGSPPSFSMSVSTPLCLQAFGYRNQRGVHWSRQHERRARDEACARKDVPGHGTRRRSAINGHPAWHPDYFALFAFTARCAAAGAWRTCARDGVFPKKEHTNPIRPSEDPRLPLSLIRP